jgi:alpha-L-fucosidase
MKQHKYFFSIMISLAMFALLTLSFTFQSVDEKSEHIHNTEGNQKENANQPIEWWREAKFGMFIHWGVYAVPAGVYKGEKVNRVSEWIAQHEHIPVGEYKQYAKQFNPVKYDPEQWACMAKEAGMKYLVITAKHHEGFALYDSGVTDWDIAGASPYGKDLLKPLVEECRENDIRIGFYYSHAVDYVHPGGEVQSLDYKPGGQWDPVQRTKTMDEYFEDIVVPQVKELLTGYGKIDILWWDGGGWYSVNKKRADMILSVTEKYPHLLMNNRLGGDYPGDWSTPEQYIPATGLGYDWETCMTMNDSWGYRSWDENWKSTKTLIRNLIDIISKGGNFLLNIGPKADGTIPEASIERLKGIGKWMKVNSESIYGTTASPFENTPFGRCSKKITEDGTTHLYLHVFNWPVDGKLTLPIVDNEILGAFLLSDENREQRKVTSQGDHHVIYVPAEAPDTICSVVRLDIKGEPVVMNPPKIEAIADIIYDRMEVTFNTEVPGVEIRYTMDGNTPTEESLLFTKGNPVILTDNAMVKAALFRDKIRVSDTREKTFSKQLPRPAAKVMDLKEGLKYEYFEGIWSGVPAFNELTPEKKGLTYFCDITIASRNELFAMRFSGYIYAPVTGTYLFHAEYNDGCNIDIGEQRVLESKRGVLDDASKEQTDGIPIVLEEGYHPFTVGYFQRIDNAHLRLYWSGPGFTKQPVKAQLLFHK